MPRTPEKTDRNARVVQLRDQGMSLNDIVFQLVADGYERITPQRVAKILRDDARRSERDE